MWHACLGVEALTHNLAAAWRKQQQQQQQQ
jgi:hypothetical protein